MSSLAISGTLNDATLLETSRAIFLPASSFPLEPVMSFDGWLIPVRPYLLNSPFSYAQSSNWIISPSVYFPALGGMRRRTSGRLGSIERNRLGTLSYIAWTPSMISLASFSLMLVPLTPALILLLNSVTYPTDPLGVNITSSRLFE